MNFKKLDELIHDGEKEIVLDSDIVLSDDEESQYLEGIELDVDELIIDGRGHTIDARCLTRIFNCSATNITIKNISLINAYSQYSGGAISINRGKVDLINVDFKNNVSDFSGGAIDNEGVLTISNSKFYKNTSEDEGGAIYNFGNILDIDGCQFIENASNEGGAIFDERGCEIKNCQFEYNTAQKGGSIFIRDYCEIKMSYFYKNTSEDGGGAIYNSNKYALIYKSNFIENCSKNSEGGAVLNFDTIRIDDSDFNENTSSQGGAITNYGNLIVFNSFFRYNQYGAIINNGESCIYKSAFKDNKYFDTAIYSLINTNLLKLIKCEFESHIKLELMSSNYDLLTVENCRSRVFGLDFEYFDIDKLENTKKRTATFKDLDNLIHSGQKEIILNSDIILDTNEISDFKKGIPIDVDNLIIDGNGYSIDAKNSSRIFKVNAKNVTIKNICLKKAFNILGGAIVNNIGSILEISNVNFLDNNVDFDGAALANFGTVVVSKSNFENNNAKSSGGAIFSMSQMKIRDSIFKNNRSLKSSAILISQFKGIKNDIEIINSKFIENIADDIGVIGIFSDMESKNNFLEHDRILSKIEINCCEFKNNSSGKGIIFNDNSLLIEECTFSGNMVRNWGIMTNDAGEMNIHNCYLKEHNLNMGNIITSLKGIIRIFNTKFIDNRCNIIQNEDNIQISDTLFENNDSSNLIVNGNLYNANFESYNNKFLNNEIGNSIIDNEKYAYIYNTIFEKNIFKMKDCYNIVNNSLLRLDNFKINDDSKSIFNQGSIFIKNSLQDYEIEGNGEIQKDTVPASHKFDFSYLDDLIHNSNSNTIKLSNDISIENYETDFYEGGIDLDIDNLVIDGNNKTIDGKFLSRIFIISAENITLKNIIFKNGFSFKSYDNKWNTIGGAIKNNFSSNVNIENCKFIDNAAEYGGGIGNHGSMTISNCEFNNNFSNIYAGALYNEGKNVEIIKSKIDNNHAAGSGNAIFSVKGNVVFSDCEFNNNYPGSSDSFPSIGPYPYVYNMILHQNSCYHYNTMGDGKMQFNDCIFNSDNKKAIFSSGKNNLKVEKCEFIDEKFEDVFTDDEKIHQKIIQEIEKQAVLKNLLQYL